MIEWNKNNGGPINKIKFSKDDIEKIILLRFSGYSTQKIAKMFGIENKGTIGNIIKSIHINGTSLNDGWFIDYWNGLKISDSVIEFYKIQNKTIEETAKILGVGVKPVRAIIKEYKLWKNLNLRK